MYTSSISIVDLAKEREWKTNSQSIKTRIRKDKIKVIHMYKKKQLRIRKNTIDINFLR